MYHLTCPSCEEKTESPFVRSGAVVHCSACDLKYRIKSAHFEREVHTGPRTLDETDSVLRSDSVDIDPEEVAPVSIDDEGNVVGLSGLSELMRGFDDQTNVQPNAPTKPKKKKGKPSKQAEDALPEAKPAKSKSKQAAKAKAKPQPTERPLGNARARAKALKREKRNRMYIMLGGTGVILIAAIVIIVAVVPMGSPSNEADKGKEDPDQVATNDPTTADPTTTPDPDNGATDPKPPDEVLVFSEDYEPSPNPVNNFVPPWTGPSADTLPTDVPMVLTPSTTLTHEGWYVMNPPRGPAGASGDNNVVLGQITAANQSDGTTLLTGSVINNNDRAVVAGELHIMLLDSTGNVFAETYTPLSMISGRAKQDVALSIPTRYWKRSRGVRAGVQVQRWADELSSLPGVMLDSTGSGPSTSLRLSVWHHGDKPLRGVSILLAATDSESNPIASFLIQEQDLYVAKDRWLDVVIATPLPQGKTAANWSAIVQPN